MNNYGMLVGKKMSIVREGVTEYMLAVKPSLEVINAVRKEREAFYEAHKSQVRVGNPYIMISSFEAKEAMENTIIRWLQRIIGEQPSFSVTLNNYGSNCYNSLHVRVLDYTPFHALAKHLSPIDMYVKSYGCRPVCYAQKPQLTLMQYLPMDVYEKAMVEFGHRTIHARFDVNELLLVRKDGITSSTRQVAMFRLQPNASSTN